MWMYNGESHTAYVRIWRLYEYVDFFIISVSPTTFSGQPKTHSFSPFEEEIEHFKDKIIIVQTPINLCYKDVYHNLNEIWCREKSQRDYSLFWIEEHFNLTNNDIILVSDVDEIFTREGLTYIKQNPPNVFYFVPGVMYFPYYFHRVNKWNNQLAMRYNVNKKGSIHVSLIRSGKDRRQLNVKSSFVTHCSYCFSSFDEFRNKLKSFSHQEYNKPPYTTNDWIFKHHYCRITIRDRKGFDEKNTDWSQLIPNDKRLSFLVDPSFELPLNLTSYTKKDLETLCNKNYRRTPFSSKK